MQGYVSSGIEQQIFTTVSRYKNGGIIDILKRHTPHVKMVVSYEKGIH